MGAPEGLKGLNTRRILSNPNPENGSIGGRGGCHSIVTGESSPRIFYCQQVCNLV
jgi:hypothetical protein